jgi:hypothetical protein
VHLTPAGQFLIRLDYDRDADGTLHATGAHGDGRWPPEAPERMVNCARTFIMDPAHPLRLPHIGRGLRELHLAASIEFPVERDAARRFAIENGWDPNTSSDSLDALRETSSERG